MLSRSLLLSLGGDVLLWESRCCRPNYHTAESTKKKKLCSLYASPPPPPRHPLLTKSLNDSHASDTPLFFYCLHQSVSKGNTLARSEIYSGVCWPAASAHWPRSLFTPAANGIRLIKVASNNPDASSVNKTILFTKCLCGENVFQQGLRTPAENTRQMCAS